MAPAVQHSDQWETKVAKVAPKVEKDGFSLQDHTTVSVDTPFVVLVLEVSLVGPQGEAAEVDLEDCKTALAGRKTILAGPKVVLVG